MTRPRPWRVGLGLAALLVVALLLGLRRGPKPGAKPVGRAYRVASCEFRWTTILPVTDSRALGYSNTSRFVVDAGGAGWIAVRSKQTRQYSICLVHAAPPWGSGMSVAQTWIEDRDSLKLSGAPQRVAAIAAAPDGSIHMAWYGGTASAPDHQIRFARFVNGERPRIDDERMPFRVPGFEAVAANAKTPIELWQEHAAIAVGPDGTTHLAWEARDPFRLTADGTPRPAIAYATRSRDGVWSVSGVLDRPPYLQLNDVYPSQSRPSILVDNTRTVHVLCYGSVGGVQQILHGTTSGNDFSGWKPVAASAGDQRHPAAALDAKGRLHVAWRERVGSGSSSLSVAVFYTVREPDGRWAKPTRLTPADENASTPAVGVTDSSVCVAWVAWKPGAVNTEDQVDNDFPADNSTVEGRVEVTSSALGVARFDPPTVLDEGPASYPCWAIGPSHGAARPALVWTSVDTTADPARRVSMKLGWCEH
ncbi:MAG TPA: hypothetical protein VN896_08210 [Methylomirabilota bacterium]|nr:hypothetical protein [Methylomirabilota bacterium]